ncbi:MAG: GNAT family N-acetyltransferase, partial [Bacteriovoracaceae bacterium]|nr:GNAT family N-acetyltransferase [Bacteriovoracaceae bacterium]
MISSEQEMGPQNVRWHLSTLAVRPNLQADVEALIEEAFNYTPPYKYGEDFYLLFAENAAHNHLIMAGTQLIGHIGVRLVTLTYQGQSLPAAFLGGIALKPAWRGQGIFKAALPQVLKLYEPQVAFFLLWSDQAQLYAQFGFAQAGSVLQLGARTDIQPWLAAQQWRPYFPAATNFNDESGRAIQKYYQAQIQNTLAIERTAHDWALLASLKSAQFF